MNIENILSSGNNVQIVLSALDLKEFALSIIAEVKASEQPKKEETYHSVEATAKMLGVDKSTLWRWEKQGYLVPVRVGRKPRYKESDIKSCLEA